ncbi:LuxR family transcriptional regulator [Streptomyces piniterrae]|uniref:LuxR family transcriptional regulator n=2 Tax=Streptomyces piniterrae TaxID=2571125 RepID=A0A4U0NKL1_9ACTN|nr:LuxR family transcriptional regulator [Streptomyces piniterrae]
MCPSSEQVEPEHDVLVRNLVLELARRGAELDPAGSASDGSGQQTLLDVEVGEVRCVLTRNRASDHRPTPAQELSPREMEIARLVGMGHTNKTIAAVLDISLYTVSTHLRRIFAKLGVCTRAAMVATLSGDLDRPDSP